MKYIDIHFSSLILETALHKQTSMRAPPASTPNSGLCLRLYAQKLMPKRDVTYGKSVKVLNVHYIIRGV